MRFTAFAAVLGLAAFVSAQNSTATTTALSPQQSCLASCGRADICCQARCVNVPCPNELQANATTECAAKCPQGDGSQSQTDEYARCQQACISSSFFPLSATATPAPSGAAGGSNAATTSGAGASSTSHSGSATAATASATTTPNAAPEVRFGAAGAGLVGLIIAGLLM